MCVKPDIGDSAIRESELKTGKFLIALEGLLSFETSWITQFLNNQLVKPNLWNDFQPLVKETSTGELEKVMRTEWDFPWHKWNTKQFKIKWTAMLRWSKINELIVQLRLFLWFWGLFIKWASEKFLGHVMGFQGQMKVNTIQWSLSSFSMFLVSSIFVHSKV